MAVSSRAPDRKCTSVKTTYSDWRTVDLIVAAVLAVASGVIFVAWNSAYGPLSVALATATPGFVAILDGVWLMGGILVALVIRRPGAAVFGEVVAATVSGIIGNQWGFTVLILGLAQGLAIELGFALARRFKFDMLSVTVAGALGGLVQGVLEFIFWYPGMGIGFAYVYVSSATLSGVLLGAFLSVVLVRALAKTGILATFGR